MAIYGRRACPPAISLNPLYPVRGGMKGGHAEFISASELRLRILKQVQNDRQERFQLIPFFLKRG